MSARQHSESRDARLVAVVTGGQGMLGRAVALALAEAGWEVLDPGHGELDVTESGSVRDWFGRLERCDLLVNNAGVTRDGLVARMTSEDWDVVVGTNLSGAACCAREAMRLMLRQGDGCILNIASHSACLGPIGQANYAAAKAGLIGFTQALAAEAGRKNIRVNAVLPGFMETPMTTAVPAAARERALAAHVLGRFTTPAESARFIAFLAGCQNISGQVFSLDSRILPWA